MDAHRFKPTPVPRARRRSQLTHFTLTDAQGRPIEVMVRDISAHGLSAAAVGEAPSLNAVVRAQLEDGRELWGLVRWTKDNLFGVEFEAPPQ